MYFYFETIRTNPRRTDLLITIKMTYIRFSKKRKKEKLVVVLSWLFNTFLSCFILSVKKFKWFSKNENLIYHNNNNAVSINMKKFPKLYKSYWLKHCFMWRKSSLQGIHYFLLPSLSSYAVNIYISIHPNMPYYIL